MKIYNILFLSAKFPLKGLVSRQALEVCVDGYFTTTPAPEGATRPSKKSNSMEGSNSDFNRPKEKTAHSALQ